jgi:hypothetical protein
MKWFSPVLKTQSQSDQHAGVFHETPPIDNRWALIHATDLPCTCCDASLKSLLSLAYTAPEDWQGDAKAQDNSAILNAVQGDILTHDLCRIGDKHFIRSVMIIPLVGCADPVILGVWVSVDRNTFDTYLTTMPLGTQGSMPLLFGTLGNVIPGYGSDQACVMQPRDHFQRPITHAALEEDPLYIAQIDGSDFDQLMAFLAGYGHKFVLPDAACAK